MSAFDPRVDRSSIPRRLGFPRAKSNGWLAFPRAAVGAGLTRVASGVVGPPRNAASGEPR